MQWRCSARLTRSTAWTIRGSSARMWPSRSSARRRFGRRSELSAEYQRNGTRERHLAELAVGRALEQHRIQFEAADRREVPNVVRRPEPALVVDVLQVRGA